MSKQMKGTISTITGAALWGVNSVAGKYVMGVQGVDPVWMVTLRMICAGIIFLMLQAFMSKRAKSLKANSKELSDTTSVSEVSGVFDILKDKKSIPRLLLISIFGFGICQATYFAAVAFANAGIASTIQQTSPLFVLIWVLLSEKRLPKKIEITVLAMVIFGAFLLSTGGDIHALIIPLSALFCGLVSAITCAMYTLLPGKLIKKYGTLPVSGWGMLIAGILMIPVVRLWVVSGTWNLYTVLAFSFIVIFGTVSAFGIYLYGVTLIGPIRGSIYGLTEPVVATIASAVLLHQVFRLTDIIGIAIILGGVTLLSVNK